jgi:PAS domain S-box-containing protein
VPRSAAGEAQLLSSILENVPLGVWVARVPGGELVYANGAFAEILGMPVREDVFAGGYSLAYQVRDREGRPYPEERLPFSQVVARREPVTVDDIVIARPDGKKADIRATGKPLFDAAGTLTHVVVAFWDVTAEVRAEAASREARDRLSTALHHAPVILFAYDRDGLITVSEGAGLRAMGFDSGELVGRSLFELYRDNPEVMENHRRVLAGETFTSSADMGPVALETWFSPMRDVKGEIIGAIGVSTDITERLRLQARVAESERLASMGRLAASVGHEINNPVAFATEAVRLAREAAAAGGDPAALRAKLDELLEDAAAGLERVRLITRDLKVFARADEDGRAPQDLDRAIAAAAKMVATRTSPHARLEIDTAARATVIADETRLVQIFVNLILNAADALPAARADQNRIAVRTRQEGDWAVVEVADNGPGIPPGLRARVFDPFFTTKPVGEGTGLGLFVSRNLVESFGGTISVGDAPGGGALFTLRFPAVASPAPRSATPVPPAAPSPDARRPRVLIIDDEPRLAALFAKTLEPEYDVRTFTSGRAGLAHLLEEGRAPYDLVLCDLMMADVSGMALYQEVARQRPGLELTIVFMTGGVFDPNVAEFLASVPNDCLDKPFDVRAEVIRRLHESEAADRGTPPTARAGRSR